MRKIILHYHLFKNAGTSLDSAFRKFLKNGEWVTREFAGNPQFQERELISWVKACPRAVCFSSHTIAIPPPEIEGLQVLPVVFLRHPIDRLVSAYRFEKKYKVDTIGSVVARNTNIKGYIEILDMLDHRQARNFHSLRLARMVDSDNPDEETRALEALESLPFVGLVECFDQSIARLNVWLEEELGRKIELRPERQNAARTANSTLEARLQEVRNELGARSYKELLNSNRIDLKLFDLVREQYGPDTQK